MCATAEHRFGVEDFAGEWERRGLGVTMRDAAETCDGKLLGGEGLRTAAGYVDGMELTFFEINKS